MQSRNCHEPCNTPSDHNRRVASTNDGTLSAIVNKSVCSVNVPLTNAVTVRDDEMLSWLHYPADDSFDRVYCSDIFGDLPNSTAQLMRHAMVNELGLRPQNAPSDAGMSPPLLCGILSHEKSSSSSINTCTTVSESMREVVESCGSGPTDHSNFRVAGADAVSQLGTGQAERLASYVQMDAFRKLVTEGDDLRRQENIECEQPSGVDEAIDVHIGGSQALTQVTSQQQGSFASMSTTSCVPKPSVPVNCHIPPLPGGKLAAANFVLFSRPAMESKARLHVLGESSGPTNIERVRQQICQQEPSRESASMCNMRAKMGVIQAKWLPRPASLPPLLPPPRPLPPSLPPLCSSSAEALQRSPKRSPSMSTLLPLPASESRDELKPKKDPVTTSNLSKIPVETGAKAVVQAVTSPSRYSGSSTEKSAKVTDVGIKRKPGAGDDSDYQSEAQYVEEMIATEKKPSFSAKRMRTAEMHNQSERKRRVKINNKLKTLQQLIPNGNKPDKASLLDAVIEYIKLLQSQLHIISMRTGIGVPSWIIPNMSMHHMQMPTFMPMSLTTDMGVEVGLGMGMRVGMSRMDANATAVDTGCAMMPVPLYPGPPPMPYSPHLALVQSTEHLQSPGSINSPHPHNLSVRHSLSQNYPLPHLLPHIQPRQQQPKLESAAERPSC